MSDFSDDDFKFESEDSLGSNRMSLSPPRRAGGSRGSRSSSSKSRTRLGGAAGRTATERPRGKGILPVNEDIANSRSSSASSSVREKSTTRNMKNSTQKLQSGVPGSDATYEELFGAVEKQQRDEELRRRMNSPSEDLDFAASGQSNFSLGLSVLSLGTQEKPPRSPSPQTSASRGFGGGAKGSPGWGKLPDTNGRRLSTQQQSRPRRTSSPGIRADSVSGRLSVFDDLLSSKRASEANSMGSSMRNDIEKALVARGAGAGRPLGDGPFDLGGRFQARNRFIYFGKDHLYSSMDSVHSMTHLPAPRDHRRKKHIPNIPYSYPLPEISFTMADLARMRWKAKTRNYKPVGPFKSAEEMLSHQGVSTMTSYTKVEVLSPDVFKKMQWKRPLHFHHCHHRLYRRGYMHDLKWQDTALEPPQELPTARRPTHELGTGSPAHGRGSLIYLPHNEESMVVEESLAYCITIQHLHRFEAACVSSFELIMKQERAGRRLIGRSFTKFVSLHIDAMLRGVEGNETRARNKLMKEILGTEDSSELRICISEGSMRFVLMCEEEEYLCGIATLIEAGLSKVLGVEKNRRDEFQRHHQHASAAGGFEEEWMIGGKYERYMLGAAHRAVGQLHHNVAYATAHPPFHHPDSNQNTQAPLLFHTPTRPVNFTCESSEQSRSRPHPRSLRVVNSPHHLIPMSTDIHDQPALLVNGGTTHGNVDERVGEIVEEQECSALVEIQPSLVEEADTFTSRLRVRLPRPPRRPATSGCSGIAGRGASRALAVTTPRNGRLPTLADTLDAFIHNQWALPNASLRSPSPTQQHLLYHKHKYSEGEGNAGTPRPLPRPSSSPPRHQSPEHLRSTNLMILPIPDRRHLSLHEDVRPQVIGQASHHRSASPTKNRNDDTPATNQPATHASPFRRQKSPIGSNGNKVSMSELRLKRERFDDQIYSGDFNNRRKSPVRGGGHHWSEQNIGDIQWDR